MIITLCGSARFRSTFDAVKSELEDSGHEVYSLTDLGVGLQSRLSHSQEERMLDLLRSLHKLKIELSDAVVVINENWYEGKHTAIDLHLAKTLSKRIFFYKAMYAHEPSYTELLQSHYSPINDECTASDRAGARLVRALRRTP